MNPECKIKPSTIISLEGMPGVELPNENMIIDVRIVGDEKLSAGRKTLEVKGVLTWNALLRCRDNAHTAEEPLKVYEQEAGCRKLLLALF